MPVVTFPPPSTARPPVRCECACCGAHVMVRASWQLTGQCGNCRSYDLHALAPHGTPPPPAPAPVPAVLDVPLLADVASPVRRVA